MRTMIELEPVPNSAPWQCLCGNGVPASGPYLRLGVRTREGDVWLCGTHQDAVLEANRLMTVRLYEQRVAELRAHVDQEAQRLATETSRLLDIERQYGDAVRAAEQANEQVAAVREEAESLRQSVSDLSREIEAANERASAAERGSVAMTTVSARFDRLESIVEANPGPESPEAKPARRMTVPAEAA
jgi:hypothetical protein